jgi:hypothetical protein
MMIRYGLLGCVLLLTACPGPTDPADDGHYALNGRIDKWPLRAEGQLVVTLQRPDQPDEDLAAIELTPNGSFALDEVPAPKAELMLPEAFDHSDITDCKEHPSMAPAAYNTATLGFVLVDVKGERHAMVVKDEPELSFVYSDAAATMSGKLSCMEVQKRFALHLVSGWNGVLQRKVKVGSEQFIWYGSAPLPLQTVLVPAPAKAAPAPAPQQ